MLNISRSARRTRCDHFKTNHRPGTETFSVTYTNTKADERIDAAVLDDLAARQAHLSCVYHYVIKTDGRVEIGRDPRTISTRVKKYDATKYGVHIGVVGGLDAKTGKRADTITPAQEQAIEDLMQAVVDNLGIEIEVWDQGITQWTRNDDRDAAAADAEEELQRQLDAE